MSYVKFLHVLFMIIWVGNLLSLTRFMGYHPKMNSETQKGIAPFYLRVYNFVGIPCMTLTILFGVILLVMKPETLKGWWFHLKLTLVSFLILADVGCGVWIKKLCTQQDDSSGVKYKILHGLCGLILIGILWSVYIFKNGA